MNADVAKEKHIKGEYYTAVISENDRVNYVLSVSSKCIVVNFMNENIDPYLSYEFHRVKDDCIFLKVASLYQYNGGERTEDKTFVYDQDGAVYTAIINLLSGEVDESEREGKADVSCNWDTFPEFGEYCNVLKKREKS